MSSHLKCSANASILLLSLASPLAGQTSPLSGIDAYIERTMSDWRVPGVAVAVVKNDSVVLRKGYSLRQRGKAAAVDENTLFYGAIHPDWTIGPADGPTAESVSTLNRPTSIRVSVPCLPTRHRHNRKT